MQSWYFDAGWGLINLSRQSLFGVFSSVLPRGHRVAEEHKEQAALLNGSASLTRDERGEAFRLSANQLQKTTPTALEIIVKLRVKYADMLHDHMAAIVHKQMH